MRETKGDLWEKHAEGKWIVVTTNPIIAYGRSPRGEVVMGRGIARQTRDKFPGFAERFAADIKIRGNHVLSYPDIKIITFPVKDHWRDAAKLSLIERSCQELVELANRQLPGQEVYLPRPGCSNGRLEWVNVKPILQKYLDDRFVVCDLVTP
ncbi:MAG: ADP-ribose-binding protein [Nitrososphaerota archaeon]|nr:hypothetical protein [Ferrimicrobium acidiphilum]MDG6933067.1 ADP-ribose-binding protein [Nitrososphaerota archaeon]